MDGGGTKTHAVIVDDNGVIVAEHTAGPSNFQIIGVEKSAETIYSLITACCESAGCTVRDLRTVVCGLTGAGRTGDQQRMADGLKKFARSKRTPLNGVIIDSDARIALEGAFNGNAGIILIAGTGSIAFGKDGSGNVHRVGGWGRVLGDEGSGYYLGRMGLTAVTREMDGRGNTTVLTNMIARRFGLTDQTAIINAVYKEGFDVASVAPLVIAAAEKKDKICRAIVENAVIELAWHVQVAAEKLSGVSQKKIKAKIPVALIGGLIATNSSLSRLLQRYLAANFPVVQIIAPMSSPAYGAAVMGNKGPVQ